MIKKFLATIAVAATLSAPASGATINYFTGGSQDNIPGLTGFATSGDMMDGMLVTACFSSAGCQPTLVWADTGAGAGGVTGAGWSFRFRAIRSASTRGASCSGRTIRWDSS